MAVPQSYRVARAGGFPPQLEEFADFERARDEALRLSATYGARYLVLGVIGQAIPSEKTSSYEAA